MSPGNRRRSAIKVAVEEACFIMPPDTIPDAPLRCYAGGQWFPSPSAALAPARRGRSWSDPAEVVGRYRTGVGGQVRTGVVGTGDVELDRSARNASSRSKNRPRMACGMLR
jgi:hypothetical protein